MLNRILPGQFDNAYRGMRAAVWLFVPLVLLRLVMGANMMWHPADIAATADAIPLSSYTGGGAQAVISLFAQIGLYRLLLALLTALALVRYRAMIPLLYLLLLLELLGSRLLDYFYPIAKPAGASGQTGSALILGILALTLIGFVLSLIPRRA
jgi:hypothetical protein